MCMDKLNNAMPMEPKIWHIYCKHQTGQKAGTLPFLPDMEEFELTLSQCKSWVSHWSTTNVQCKWWYSDYEKMTFKAFENWVAERKLYQVDARSLISSREQLVCTALEADYRKQYHERERELIKKRGRKDLGCIT